jgi:hypothetical protein
MRKPRYWYFGSVIEPSQALRENAKIFFLNFCQLFLLLQKGEKKKLVEKTIQRNSQAKTTVTFLHQPAAPRRVGPDRQSRLQVTSYKCNFQRR